jgi:hypothetical protein
MLVDEQGNNLDAIRKADHWRLFEVLLQTPSVANPLRSAVDGHISATVAAQPPGGHVAIDSTAGGPPVFARLGAQWATDYAQWHSARCVQNPKYRTVTAERMYGMMLWYVLATDRQERWLVPPQGAKRVYKLLRPGCEVAALSAERQLLLEVRQVLREQIAKLDAILGPPDKLL